MLSIRNGTSLKQLINDIAEWETYLDDRSKLNHPDRWVASVFLRFHPNMKILPDGSYCISADEANQLITCYFGPGNIYSRAKEIDKEIEKRLDPLPKHKDEKFFELLARKFEVWMIRFYHKHNKEFSDDKHLLTWLSGDMNLYYISDYDQYRSLVFAVSQRGFKMHMPANDDELLGSLNLFAETYKKYIYNVKFIVKMGQSKYPTLYARALHDCPPINLAPSMDDHPRSFYLSYKR